MRWLKKCSKLRQSGFPNSKKFIKKYPFGSENLLDLECAARKDPFEEVEITATSTLPVSLLVRWKEGKKEIKI